MDNEITCQECAKNFKTERALHTHFKAHKMSVEEYYYKHYPRTDKYSGEIIPFKSKDYYFSTDFVSRQNLRLWLSKQSKEEAQKYCIDILLRRKREKNLQYTMTQVELRSLLTPPIHYYEDIFGDYYKLCNDLGFINKHRTINKPPHIGKFNRYAKTFSFDDTPNKDYICIDTREQKPLLFNFPYKIKTLNFGDYCFSDNEFTGNLYIERKASNDFFSTLSSQYERFCNEIERAREANARLIVVVEETLENCLIYNDLPSTAKRVKVEFAFHNVREILQKYPHVQFLFVKNRKEATKVIEKLFFSGKWYLSYDAQLAYDLGLFD
jgi:hypothetical protein